IDAPAIDSDALHRPVECARTVPSLAQPLLNLLEDLGKIPTQMTGRFRSWILKTADFVEQEFARVRSCQKYPPTASAQIDGNVERMYRRLSSLRRRLMSDLFRILRQLDLAERRRLDSLRYKFKQFPRRLRLFLPVALRACADDNGWRD